MLSPRAGSPRPARDTGLAMQLFAPALALLVVFVLIGLYLTNQKLLHEGKARDFARATRYTHLGKLLLEAQLQTTPVETILQQIRSAGLREVEFLPPDQPPHDPSPAYSIPDSCVGAWDTVVGSDGKTAGFIHIHGVEDSARLFIVATRVFTVAFILATLALFAMIWWTLRVLILRRIGRMQKTLGSLAPEADAPATPPQGDRLDELEMCLKRTIEQWQRQRAALQRLLEGHSEAACLGTREGVLLEVNAAYCRLFEKSREELVGRNYLDTIPPAERSDVVNSLARVSRDNPVDALEHSIILPGGETRWMRWHNTAAEDLEQHGNVILSFGLDITAEKELATRLDGLRQAFDQMQSLASTGSLTWDFARDRMEWTAEAARLLGVDARSAQPTLQTLLSAVCLEDRNNLAAKFKAARENGDPFEVEFRVALPDNKRRFLQSRGEVNTDPNTKLLSFLTCTLRDITELREAESAKLRESIFREAVENAVGVGIVVLDKEGLPLSANPAYLQMIGWTESELRAMRAPYPFWPEKNLPEIREAMGLALSGQTPAGGSQLKFRHKNGALFDVLINTVKLHSADGEQLGYVSSITDISAIQETRRKLAEAETVAREELALRETIEKAFGMGLYVSDMQGDALSVNDGFAAMTGLTKKEILAQKPPFSWWPEEEIADIKQAWESAFVSGEIPPEGFEMTFRRKDGTRFDVLDLLAPLRDAQGRQTGWISLLIDITKIQQTRRQLREANEVLTVAAEVAELGIWTLDPAGCRTEWSRRSFAIHGDPDGQNPSATYHRNVPPADRERSDAYLREVIESGDSTGRNEMDVVWPDGSIHRILSHFRVIRSKNDQAPVIVGIHRDITEFLRREQKARDSEHRLLMAIESAQLGTFEYVFGTGTQNWNSTNYELYGIDPAITGPAELFEEWKKVVGEETYRRLMDDFSRVPPTQRIHVHEFTVPAAGGPPQRVRTCSYIDRDTEGHPVRLLGITQRIGNSTPP